MEGRILGNRYELLEKIGGGGMALVYKAKCRLLNRFVAIKILRSEFTNDEEFVKRFIIEAQSAASLSHPNIIPIYDVGHEDNIHYIVMEYVDGITLKEYMAQKGVLKWREAVNIAIQICSAIEHAHRNHIVHRDIKPHNILLTKEGIAKIGDFGIARAVSSSTITMVGSTIGSVHYFSPEQARGGYVDEKSDLYSIGIALYEMVTGVLPFDGDTPVAVALKHIQVEAKSPVEIDHNIPKGVNNIIIKAIKKDQSIRYQSASDLLGDLYMVLKQPEGDFIAEETAEEDFATRRVPVIGGESFPKDDSFPAKTKEMGKKKGDKLTITLAVVTSLIIITIFGYMAYKLVVPNIIPAQQSDFTVENFVGQNINDVKDKLFKAGFTDANVKVNRKNDDTVKKDIIMSQDQEQGKKLKPGGFNTITFVVSDGEKLVTIPDYAKKDYRAAERELKESGLDPKVEDAFDDSIASGLVIKTEPAAGESVSLQTPVVIYKSKGPELKPVKVPNLLGLTRNDAQKLLLDKKLVLGKVDPEDSKNYVAKVIKQDPQPNTDLKEGSPVNITLESNNTQTGTQAQRKMMPFNIALQNPDKYKSRIKVRIEAIPSDTNRPEILVDEIISKNKFPLPISVPVPHQGKTEIAIYFDDQLVDSFTQPDDSTGGQ